MSLNLHNSYINYVLIVIGISGLFIGMINDQNTIYQTVQLSDHGKIILPKNATYSFEMRLRVNANDVAEINGSLNIYNANNTMIDHWNFNQSRHYGGNIELDLIHQWKQKLNNSDEALTYNFTVYSLKGKLTQANIIIYKNKPTYPSIWDNFFFVLLTVGSLEKIYTKLTSKRKNNTQTREILTDKYEHISDYQTFWLKTRNFYPVYCEKENKDTLSIKILHGGLLEKTLYILTPGISIFTIALVYSLPILFIVLIVLFIQNQLTSTGIILLSGYFSLTTVLVLLFSILGLDKGFRKPIEKEWISFISHVFHNSNFTQVIFTKNSDFPTNVENNIFFIDDILGFHTYNSVYDNYKILHQQYEKMLFIFLKDGSSVQLGGSYGRFLPLDLLLLEEFCRDFLVFKRIDYDKPFDINTRRLSKKMTTSPSLQILNPLYSSTDFRPLINKIRYSISDVLFILFPVISLNIVMFGIAGIVIYLQPNSFSMEYFIIFFIGGLLLATTYYYVCRLVFTFIDADSERYNGLSFILKKERELPDQIEFSFFGKKRVWKNPKRNE